MGTHLNPLKPRGAYMHHQTRPSLVQIMACCLFGAKPLSESMLDFCKVDPLRKYVLMECVRVYLDLTEQYISHICVTWREVRIMQILCAMFFLSWFGTDRIHRITSMTVKQPWSIWVDKAYKLIKRYDKQNKQINVNFFWDILHVSTNTLNETRLLSAFLATVDETLTLLFEECIDEDILCYLEGVD